MIPKFKAEHDQILWDCLFDINVSKYQECFDKVRRQLYNLMPNASDDVIRQITNELILNTTKQLIQQKPEYDV